MTFPSKHRAGFSLVEVTLALGVAAFCLIAIFVLLPVGLASNQAAVEQTTAGNIATNIAADLAAAPLTSGSSTRLGFNIKAASGTVQTLFCSEDGNPTGKVGDAASNTTKPSSRYRACIGFYPGTQKKATMVRILVTWPAAANPSATGWPTKFSGSFETVTAVNRN